MLHAGDLEVKARTQRATFLKTTQAEDDGSFVLGHDLDDHEQGDGEGQNYSDQAEEVDEVVAKTVVGARFFVGDGTFCNNLV